MKRSLPLLAALLSSAVLASQPRELDFNFDWKFYLQPEGAEAQTVTPLDDQDWRDVRLPHDWSVEHSFSEDLEGCTGYLPGGIGWYQKHFPTPKGSDRTFVLFDGVYNNSVYWLNGTRLGENPNGYTPVYFDLTDLLKKDGSENILTVYVDHSRYADARWYTGSGIYRNVKLLTLNSLHIPIWGTFLTTPEITDEQGSVNLEVKIANTDKTSASFRLSTSIMNQSGQIVATRSSDFSIAGKKEQAFTQTLSVANPELWDTVNPNMYKAVTTLTRDGEQVDTYTTPFGFRTLKTVADEGFYLNGKLTDIKGVCLHHDGGLVGAAVPKGVWERRLRELQAGGVNAIRLSHNPFSEEFLDLCDELGILVQNEIFDEWDYAKDKRLNYHDRNDDYITRGYVEHFQKWHKSDLTRTMLRDRNHPSVFQWSIGNEIEWTYLHYRYVTGFWPDPDRPQHNVGYWSDPPKFSPKELKKRYEESEKGEYILTETAERLAGLVRELDTTRPVTANMIVPQVSLVSGYADAVDISGFSYRNMTFGWAQKHFPEKSLTINECGGNWDDWKTVIERPGVFSMYMWTAIDYMGESNDDWPNKAWHGDMLNLAGFRNQGWNHFKSIWVNEPHISIGTLPMKDSKFKVDPHLGPPIAKDKRSYSWGTSNTHWDYEPGEMVLVEVCSNHSMVELFLNGKSLGSRSMSENPDRLFRWSVPFQPGTLTARAGFTGAMIEAEFETPSDPAGISLTADNVTLDADGYDVAHLVVQLVDEEGRPVKTENRKVTFSIEGDARMLGVDTGARDNVQDFQSDSIVTDQGRCLLIVQANRTAGDVIVTAKSEGFDAQAVRLSLQ